MLIISWVISRHSLGPNCCPTSSFSSSMPLTVVGATARRLSRPHEAPWKGVNRHRLPLGPRRYSLRTARARRDMNARKVIGMVACVACALALLGGAAAQAAPFLYSANTIGESVSQFELRGRPARAPRAAERVDPLPAGPRGKPGRPERVHGQRLPDKEHLAVSDRRGRRSAVRRHEPGRRRHRSLRVGDQSRRQSLYATGYFSILQFDVAADGSLAPKTPTSAPAGSSLNGFAMTSDGRNLDRGRVRRVERVPVGCRRRRQAGAEDASVGTHRRNVTTGNRRQPRQSQPLRGQPRR